MAHFLDQVRRKSGFPADSSDDDLSIDTDEQERKKLGLSSTTRVSRTSVPRSIGRPIEPQTPVVAKRTSTSLPSASGGVKNAGQLPVNQLTLEDLEICQRLDDEYERALEEREIGYNARYASVRQSAVLSVFFMVAFMSLGTAFFMRQAAWTLPESMLFSIYSITTVGYGRTEMPTTPGFQAYTIFYILVGIAALTIMVGRVVRRLVELSGIYCEQMILMQATHECLFCVLALDILRWLKCINVLR